MKFWLIKNTKGDLRSVCSDSNPDANGNMNDHMSWGEGKDWRVVGSAELVEGFFEDPEDQADWDERFPRWTVNNQRGVHKVFRNEEKVHEAKTRKAARAWMTRQKGYSKDREW